MVKYIWMGSRKSSYGMVCRWAFGRWALGGNREMLGVKMMNVEKMGLRS